VLGWSALLAATSAGAITIPPETERPLIEVVDGYSRVSDVHDIVVDSQGRPHLAYIERSQAATNQTGLARVRYAWFDGWTWRDETLGNINEREDTAVNRWITLAVGTNGVHVLAVESNGETTVDDRLVRFHRRLDASVTRQTIRSGEVAEPSIAIDRLGTVFVAWRRLSLSLDGLEVGTLADDGTVNVLPLATGPRVGSPSLATRVNAFGGSTGAILGWTECTTLPDACGQRAAQLSSTAVTPLADILAPTPDGGGFVRMALDADFLPEAMLIVGPPSNRRIELRRFSSGVWSCLQGRPCEVATPEALLAGARPAPHAFAHTLFGNGDPQALNRAISVRLATRATVLRDRVGFPGFIDLELTVAPLPPPELRLGSVALNRDGRAVLVGNTQDSHTDLLALTIDRPWRGRRAPDSTAVALQTGLALARERDGTPLVLGRDAGGSVRLLRWRNMPTPEFVSESLPVGLDPDAASMAIDGGGDLHVAVHDRNGNDLVYAYRPAGSMQPWTTERLLIAGDAGLSPSIHVYPDGTPAIVCLDGDGNVVLLHRQPGGSWGQRVLSADSTPGVAAAPRAAVADAGFLLRATWFDPASGRLMLSSLAGNPADITRTISIETTVDTGSIEHGRQHDIALLGDGQPMIAYTAGTTSQNLLMRYRRPDGVWVPGVDVPTQLDQYFGLRLNAGAGSPFQARLAYVERRASGDRFWVVAPDGGGGQIASMFGTLGSVDADAPMVALNGSGQMLMAVAENTGTTVLRLREPMSPPAVFAALPPGSDGTTQTLPTAESAPVCHCLVLAIMNIDCAEVAQLPLPMLGNDLGTMHALQQRFATTEAGRYYLNLFRTHSNEIMSLTLSDPVRLAERWRTWQDLLPGFRALNAGQGNIERFTPERIAAARGVLQGWAEAGSPALQQTVEAELDRLGDLNVFLGMGFADWFDALTPNDTLFTDQFEPVGTQSPAD
jgi:hypothetical protein